MQIQNFVSSSPELDGLGTEVISPELQLYSTAKPDREPVKILIIGSPIAVDTIIHLLHNHHFAEPFEWTQFLPTERPIQLRPGEAIKALIKYLPRP